MNAQEIITKCNQIPNGAFFKMVWTTNCEKKMLSSAKKEGHIVLKNVSSVCRKGIHYGQIKKVQEAKTASGDFLIDPETGKKEFIFSWREWAEEVIPNLIIKHKKTGKLYMVVYATETHPKIQYMLDGHLIDTKRLKDSNIMQPSYWDKDNPVTFTIPIESIKSIGKER